ncbi:MAG: hypothetical protein NVS3B25_31560 [Hymenobacter sp.]
MRLSPAAFWKLTPAEFDALRRGHQRAQVQQWQHTRWLGTLLVNLQRGPDDVATLPEDLLPLPGDEDYAQRTAPAKVLTPAEKAAMQQRVLERAYSTPLPT